MACRCCEIKVTFSRKPKAAQCLKLIAYRQLLTQRLNSQTRHAGHDPASGVFLDSRPLPTKGQAYGNDNRNIFNCRSNK